jgi:hypothetical protein
MKNNLPRTALFFLNTVACGAPVLQPQFAEKAQMIG